MPKFGEITAGFFSRVSVLNQFRLTQDQKQSNISSENNVNDKDT